MSEKCYLYYQKRSRGISLLCWISEFLLAVDVLVSNAKREEYFLALTLIHISMIQIIDTQKLY
jgi:hypothetical protein